MGHTSKNKDKLLNRVKRIKGQVEGIERGLEEGRDCGDMLQLIAAVRGAVNGLMAEVLEGHLREHLGADGVEPKQRRDDLEQVVGVLRSYLK